MPWKPDNGPTKDECLKHYADREPTYFVQFDGWDKPHGAVGYPGDGDGQEINGGRTYELMTGAYAVRVLLRPGYPKARVLMLLDKIRQWIDRGDPIDASHWDPPEEPPIHVRTCEELARDIMHIMKYAYREMVLLSDVEREAADRDGPSVARIVESLESLERDGKIWCLYDKAGAMQGCLLRSPGDIADDEDFPF